MKAMGWPNSSFDVATQMVLNIDDSVAVVGENISRPSNPEPTLFDLFVLCYFLKICKQTNKKIDKKMILNI